MEIYLHKKKKYSSNSLGKNIRYQIKNVKLLKELDIIDNNKNINNNNLNLKKESTILIPRRQKTAYTLDSYHFQNLKNLNMDNNKNKCNIIFINNKKYMVLSPDIINRKKTETGLSNFSFKKKYLLENNNIRKIILNKNNIKNEKVIEDKRHKYGLKNNYIKEQIISSYIQNKIPKKKNSHNFRNLNLVHNDIINNF